MCVCVCVCVCVCECVCVCVCVCSCKLMITLLGRAALEEPPPRAALAVLWFSLPVNDLVCWSVKWKKPAIQSLAQKSGSGQGSTLCNEIIKGGPEQPLKCFRVSWNYFCLFIYSGSPRTAFIYSFIQGLLELLLFIHSFRVSWNCFCLFFQGAATFLWPC